MKNITIYLLFLSILLFSCQSNQSQSEYLDEEYIDTTIVDTLFIEDDTTMSYEYEESSLKKPKNYSTTSKIYLDNPSFDLGISGHSTTPLFWSNNCKFKHESPPDVHSSGSGHFYVSNKSIHGKQYLGLVTRKENTYESIFQKLTFPLKKDNRYSFSLFLAKSDTYISLSKANMKEMYYNKASVLRIWGGEKECDKSYLIYESSPVNHKNWKKYKIEFTAQKDIPYLSFEAFYTDANNPQNGNVLIDNISPIYKISN